MVKGIAKVHYYIIIIHDIVNVSDATIGLGFGLGFGFAQHCNAMRQLITNYY